MKKPYDTMVYCTVGAHWIPDLSVKFCHGAMVRRKARQGVKK